MIEIDGITIPFDPRWNKIAISVSGGADSALLAYLICDFIRKNDIYPIQVHVINHIRSWKTKPWQQHNAQMVYRYLFNEFRHISFKNHTNFIAPELEWSNQGPTMLDEYGKQVSGDNIEQRAYAEYICHRENVDAYYNAVTRNPRNVDFKGMPSRDIDPTEDNQHLRVTTHMGRLAVHPFRFIEKSWVIKQYKDLELYKLLELTRSCEGIFTNLNYKNYKAGQLVPICGECFWCREREWAFEQLQ
jgi:7-cyano-7-deazaguanine synthase in queuosine biosynthesis